MSLLCTLERDALHAALGRVAKIVERRATIPILSNLLIAAEPGAGPTGHLRLRGTDLDMEASTCVPAEVASPGAVTVPAHLLAEITAKYAAGAQIRIEQTEATILVKSGRSRVTIHTLPAADFPDIGPQPMTHVFDLASADLLALIAKTEFAISSEETRYYLNGLYWHAPVCDGERLLRAVATDGHRLARWQMPAPEGAADMPGIIVPRKAVGELKRLAKEATGPITLSLNDRRLCATIPGKGGMVTEFTTKLIDGTFPDYQRVIPSGNDKRADLPREAMIASVDRVACIGTERGRAIRLSFADDQLVLAMTQAEAGSAADEIDITYASAPIEVGFNAGYLGELMGVLAGDRVRLDLGDPGSPAVFRETGSDTLLLVLMPMRV